MHRRTQVFAICSVLVCSSVAMPQDSPWATRMLAQESEWTYSDAEGINEAGLIVGRYAGSSYRDEHAVVWTDTGYIELEDYCGIPPEFTNSVAWGINESGLICGEVKVQDGSQPIQAVLWDYNAQTYELIHPVGTGFAGKAGTVGQ